MAWEIQFFLGDDILLAMEYVLRIWKLKRPNNGDDDDLEYIIGAVIAMVAIVVGYVRHAFF
jgi:hypothetical protein